MAASEFGLVFQLPPALRKIYLQFTWDLEKRNGNDSWISPMDIIDYLDQLS